MGGDSSLLPPAELDFDAASVLPSIERMQTRVAQLFKAYRRERHGPTVLLVQSALPLARLVRDLPTLEDFPLVPLMPSSETYVFSSLVKLPVDTYLKLCTCIYYHFRNITTFLLTIMIAHFYFMITNEVHILFIN